MAASTQAAGPKLAIQRGRARGAHGMESVGNFLYIGMGPRRGNPLKVYASLATLYMLTQSQAVAYGMWQLSQGQEGSGLSPQRIETAEQLAREQYAQILSVRASSAKPGHGRGGLGD